MNAFALYLAYVVAGIVRAALSSRDDGRPWFLGVIVEQVVFIACQIAFTILGSLITAWFSRQREFRADAGGRRALRPRQHGGGAARADGEPGSGRQPQPLAGQLKISGGKGLRELFQTHPPLEQRIAVLEGRTFGSGQLAPGRVGTPSGRSTDRPRVTVLPVPERVRRPCFSQDFSFALFRRDERGEQGGAAGRSATSTCSLREWAPPAARAQAVERGEAFGRGEVAVGSASHLHRAHLEAEGERGLARPRVERFRSGLGCMGGRSKCPCRDSRRRGDRPSGSPGARARPASPSSFDHTRASTVSVARSGDDVGGGPARAPR